ncbi:Biopterin-dependent aromatic amino acid hydroxylase, partial [Teladorsagia circumcincta]
RTSAIRWSGGKRLWVERNSCESYGDEDGEVWTSGEPIPYVDYTKEEHETWRAVYEKLRDLRESHACSAYRRNLKLLEDEGVLTPNKIPQIRDVNKYLQSKLTTTYLRHGSKPHHSPEPDLIHELLGHVPMFADPMVAQMSQDIGLMSLGATDEQIEKLATVYWFIIEFGLCREDGQLKAIGAGLLSAYGELMAMADWWSQLARFGMRSDMQFTDAIRSRQVGKITKWSK